jgi:hypothetical protein
MCKAADVVSSSREYTFKNTPLGMIAPILDEFSVATKLRWTSFYMQLSPEYNAQELMTELCALDPRPLIFLRRLRNIYATIGEDNSKIWETNLSRSESTFEGHEIIQLLHNDASLSYIAMQHEVERLCPEPKRDAVSESNILLAFPLNENQEPQRNSQQVYAFLLGSRIRVRGTCSSFASAEWSFFFMLSRERFLLQADFLLTASREEIDRSSRRNQALRNGFIEAIYNAINRFNSRTTSLSLTTISPSAAHCFRLFSPLKRSILTQPAKGSILESWNEQIVRQTTLLYVSKMSRDNADTPLSLTPGKGLVYCGGVDPTPIVVC